MVPRSFGRRNATPHMTFPCGYSSELRDPGSPSECRALVPLVLRACSRLQHLELARYPLPLICRTLVWHGSRHHPLVFADPGSRFPGGSRPVGPRFSHAPSFQTSSCASTETRSPGRRGLLRSTLPKQGGDPQGGYPLYAGCPAPSLRTRSGPFTSHHRAGYVHSTRSHRLPARYDGN